ncbi:MAG: ATP-binding protein [Planctomycetes bacterium]|nr:ATP-binding protein [Planctomycetota bacterium]
MIQRLVNNLIRERLRQSPAVGLVGPRQCGKTTLARSLAGRYFDLEVETERLRLDLQWTSLVEGKELVILDEAQSWPEVFPRLRSAIDQDRRTMGRFLLLGSVSPGLARQVSESLAGRLSLVELTPFLLEELSADRLDDLWLFGGYPDGGILDAAAFGRWQRDYLTLLTQRDLPQWGLPARAQTTERLLRMVAAVHGQAWNASRIGQSLGLNYQTINSYLEYLIGAFLIRRLEPYHANLRKRLTKSPKMYWRDTGLLHTLLQTRTRDDLLAQPWVGASWEGFVIEQVLSHLAAWGRTVQPYFLHTADRYEIGLVLDFGRSLWAVEAKLTANPSVGDVQRLNKVADLIQADQRVLVARVREPLESAGLLVTDVPGLLKKLREAGSPGLE